MRRKEKPEDPKRCTGQIPGIGTSVRCYFNKRPSHETCAGHAEGIEIDLDALLTYEQKLGSQQWSIECGVELELEKPKSMRRGASLDAL